MKRKQKTLFCGSILVNILFNLNILNCIFEIQIIKSNEHFI